MPEMMIVFICPQCSWSSRVRYVKKRKIMVCGHCPFEGQPKDFEQLIPYEEGNSDEPMPETT